MHWPSKVRPVGVIASKICSTIETTGCFIPKKYQTLVFYDNRDLKIFKFKKSEQYFVDKFEIFIRSFDDPLLCSSF